MIVTLNGEQRELEAGACVAAAVTVAGAAVATGGVAVAVDGEVVPRSEWEATELHEGQSVEVVVAVQGG